MPNNPFSKEVLPNIQPKTPLAQLKPIPPRPVTSLVGEQANPHLTTASFNVLIESEVSPEFLLNKPSSLSHSLITNALMVP